MAEAFLALITPLGNAGASGPVDPGYSPPWAQVPPGQTPQPPLGFWGPNDPRPTPPIAGPGRPPGWGMGGDPGYSPPWARPPVDPGYSPPWATPQPPYPSQGPGFPTNPIAGPGRPPGWGMAGDPGYGIPESGRPYPSHPIYFPPDPVDPGFSPPWAQVPDLPPTVPPAQGSGGEPVPVEWKTGWTPVTGWVVVGVPTGNVPTPSAA